MKTKRTPNPKGGRPRDPGEKDSWYRKNPEAAKAWHEDRWSRHNARISALKLDAGCADCGYRDHPAALHFDHLPEHEKAFNISVAYTYSAARIDAEIAKCEVVCANCHAIRTVTRRAA